MERYEVMAPTHGSRFFGEGPATADADAIVCEHGAVVDEQSWTREFPLTIAPRR